MPFQKTIKADIGDISQLQGTCNWFENSYTARLTGLKTGKDDANKDATVASFDELNDEVPEAGLVRLTEGGTHTAYINGVSKKITISRA